MWVPDAAHEAMRDLVRARATARRVLGKARQHLQGFLLRHGRIYRGIRGWTRAYRRWLTTVRFDHPAQQIVLQDYIHAVENAEARLECLERQIEELLPRWRWRRWSRACRRCAGSAGIARLDPELIHEIALLPEATRSAPPVIHRAPMPIAGPTGEVGAIAAHYPAACKSTIDGQVSSTTTEPRVPRMRATKV